MINEIIIAMVTGILSGYLVNSFAEERNRKKQIADLMIEAMWVFYPVTQETKKYLKSNEVYEIEFEDLRLDVITELLDHLGAPKVDINLIKDCRNVVNEIVKASKEGDSLIVSEKGMFLTTTLLNFRAHAFRHWKAHNKER